MTDAQRLLLKAIVRRCDACKRYAEICLRSEHAFVEEIGAFGAWNLIKTFLLLYGARLRRDAAAWLFEKLQDEAGVCSLCGEDRKRVHTDIACTACLARMDEEDRQVDIHIQMERPVKGREM